MSNYRILSKQANDFIKNNGLICGQYLPGDRMAFGALFKRGNNNGQDGNILITSIKAMDCRTKFIYGIYMNPSGDKASPLWLALNSGFQKLRLILQ